MEEFKQLHLDIEQPKEEIKESPKEAIVDKPQQTQIVTFNPLTIPSALQTSAESSVMLRDIQKSLASIITDENYISLIASTSPEVLPELLNSITSAVATSDNLLIQMAKVAEKNSSLNRVFEFMTKQQESKSQKITEDTHDEYYDESIERIKAAIYTKLDKEQHKVKRSATNYIDVEVIQNDDDNAEEDS